MAHSIERHRFDYCFVLQSFGKSEELSVFDHAEIVAVGIRANTMLSFQNRILPLLPFPVLSHIF